MDPLALERFLADPNTYRKIDIWECRANLRQTADLYRSTVRDLHGYEKREFRKEFRRMRLDDKLEIHEVLNVETDDEPRITKEEFERFQSHFNSLNVEREEFGRAVLGLPRDCFDQLQELAKTRDARNTAKDALHVHIKVCEEIAAEYEMRHLTKSTISSNDVSLLLQWYHEMGCLQDIAVECILSLEPLEIERIIFNSYGVVSDISGGLRKLAASLSQDQIIWSADLERASRRRTRRGRRGFGHAKPNLLESTASSSRSPQPTNEDEEVTQESDEAFESALEDMTPMDQYNGSSAPPSELDSANDDEVSANVDNIIDPAARGKANGGAFPDDILSSALIIPEFSPTNVSSISLQNSNESQKRELKKSEKTSPFFKPESPAKRRCVGSRNLVSSIQFPPLTAKSFGLIQEILADDPFHFLIAVIFLNKTRASVALPVFWELIERFPTASDLCNADMESVVAMIRPLGLQNARAKTLIALANSWIENPPAKGYRYRTLHYPAFGNGKDIKPNEILTDEDERIGAWEVAHFPGVGRYATDSWRIFCRDKLRGFATGYNGEGALGEDFEPEWKRVVPTDKELRAFLRWMWLREGWEWNPLNGNRTRASEDLMREAQTGNLIWEEWEDMTS